MPRFYMDIYSAYPWRTKALLDWRSLFSSLPESLKHNEPHWFHACTASHQVLQWLLWKHHFAPLDTSSALALASSNSSQPHPIVPTPAPLPLPLPLQLIPPIHRLPPELITTIFFHTLHPSPRTPKDRFCHQITRRISSSPFPSSPFPTPSPTTPLLLTHICHSWRHLAHHTPSLWSSIHVLCPVRSDVAFIAFLLAQTGSSCPLTLGLAHYTTPDPAAEAIARLFVAQAHRWRRVSFTLMRCVQPAFAGLRPGLGGVPLLEAYEVRVDTWAEEDIEAFFDVLHSSERLEGVDWGKSLAGMREDTPWCRLVELTLHCMDLSQTLFSSLADCAELKTLRMRRMTSNRPSSFSPPPRPIPITLDRVESLVCDRVDSSAFSSLTLPSLRDLEVTSRHPHPVSQPDIDALLEMLDRSGCVLRSLGVDGYSVPLLFRARARAEPVFRDVVALTVLSDIRAEELALLARSGLDLNQIQTLPQLDPDADRHRDQDQERDQDRPDILPNLRHLILHNYHGNDGVGVLARVASSRRDELRELQVCLDLGGAGAGAGAFSSSPSSPSSSSSVPSPGTPPAPAPAPAPSPPSLLKPSKPNPALPPHPHPHKHEQDLRTLLHLASSGVRVSVHEPVSRFPTFYFRGNPREPEHEGDGDGEPGPGKGEERRGKGAAPMMHMPDLDTLW
ncbi:hypothetical protein GALMADRAFT_1033430 [Galerina marginata CBS 339.88]|uniref:Uncharacterized protein n=1 Tax=Galerina marginata (strain CBS 339.88) TaxID=685588 RepID=A0A067SCB3_GALM3|nr:hypothetical protein GALMADRAFT_1033430 [Galerina marginata CBS 339.88]